MKRAVEIAEAKANGDGDEVPATKKAKVVDTSEHLPVPPGQGFEKNKLIRFVSCPKAIYIYIYILIYIYIYSLGRTLRTSKFFSKAHEKFSKTLYLEHQTVLSIAGPVLSVQ